jgi:uroporphyrinogen decarboxylase
MDGLFLRACRGEATPCSPIWIMRQAGRYLPEYRAVRERIDFLELCKTPELAAQVTLQPIDRFGFDAAILFSDIMVPAEPLGIELSFAPGPVLAQPVRSAAAVDRLRVGDPEEDVGFVFETIRLVRRELGQRAALIGFAATPFTLAAYLVEGRGSKQFPALRGLLYENPALAHRLLATLTELSVRYLSAQAAAGAQALQLFDSWVGLLAAAEYREFGLRYVKEMIERLRPTGVPLIYFALDAAHLLTEIRDCGANVVGLDWRVPLDRASEQLDHRFVLQGNLDPCLLLGPTDRIERGAREILALAEPLPGHIFNLGHGVLPETPVENVETLVRSVRGSSPRV